MQLSQRIEEIQAYVNENNIELPNKYYKTVMDVIEETRDYTNPTTLGKYTISYESGYCGYEDGGSQVSFLISIQEDGKDKEFFHVTGYYDSWDGGEVYYSSAERVKVHSSKTITYTVDENTTVYTNDDGRPEFTQVKRENK